MEKKLISTAKIETPHAGKYLVQLAKHWSHRFPDLTWNETRADIPFPAGQCVVTSKENVLAIALTVPDEETASRLENGRGRAFEPFCVSRVSGDCLATGVIASYWRTFTRSIRQIILPRGAF